MTKLAVLGTVLLSLTASLSGQQNDILQVFVRASNGLGATLIAGAQPYFEAGPVAKMYLPSGVDARTRDGRPIVGFEFSAWMEGDTVRGQVFALVGSSGAPNVDLRYRADLVDRDEFASYRLRAGETMPITEMRSVGLEPMVVEGISLRELAARLEQIRTSLRIQ